MRRPRLSRSLPAVTALVLTAGLLTGCSGDLFGGCTPVFQPGDASSTVSASGEIDESPAIEFPTPLIPDGVERSVLLRGEGDPVAEGDTVRLELTMIDASSDEVIAEGGATIAANDAYLGLGESLVCATPGTRLAVVGDPADLGLNAAAPVVVVIDVEEVFLGKANGVNQLPLDGMPTVVTAVDGTPGIAVGYAAVPDEARTSTIKAGGGATVEGGDTVIFHGRSWSWAADGDPSIGELDTWARFQPQTLEIDDASEEPVVQALEGAKVGSQLLVVVPGADEAPATIFVLDVLGIVGDE